MNDWYSDARTRISISKDEFEKERKFRQGFKNKMALLVLFLIGLGVLLIQHIKV